jgi:phosphodiesterase/alkaline phosphatase D-like protein
MQTASANLVWKPYLQQLTDASVIILWVTQTGQNPTVRYATDTSYSASATGSSRTVSGEQLHRIQLTGLEPDAIYYYKVYTEDQDLLPDELLSFQTAPRAGSTAPFTFVVFGDYGIGSDSQRQLRDQMLLDSFRFILSTGDNAYHDGTYSQFDANVFQIYQDIFSKAAVFPTLGNHDYHTDDGAPYLDIFDLPPNAWRAGDVERYYAFDFGNVHFVALDSNVPMDVNDSAASDDMFDWLRSDLSQTAQPWRVAALHHPAYSAGSHGSDSQVQSKLVPIF